VSLIASLAKVVATTKSKVATTISMAKTKATSKTKTNAVDTAEVLPVKVWDPKWENSNKIPTKNATTMPNVPLTHNGAKKRMRWYLSSN
jgi:hypothetical protein